MCICRLELGIKFRKDFFSGAAGLRLKLAYVQIVVNKTQIKSFMMIEHWVAEILALKFNPNPNMNIRLNAHVFILTTTRGVGFFYF